jgi:hypothetical protein
MDTKKCNWAVVVTNKDCTALKGIYSTKRAAQFISQRVKFNEKLNYYPNVVETDNDLYPENNRVEEWLAMMERKKINKERAKYMPKKHRPLSQ